MTSCFQHEKQIDYSNHAFVNPCGVNKTACHPSALCVNIPSWQQDKPSGTRCICTDGMEMRDGTQECVVVDRIVRPCNLACLNGGTCVNNEAGVSKCQ